MCGGGRAARRGARFTSEERSHCWRTVCRPLVRLQGEHKGGERSIEKDDRKGEGARPGEVSSAAIIAWLSWRQHN